MAGRCRSWRVNGGNLEVLTPLAGPVYGEHTSPVYPNVKNPYNFVTVQIITIDATGVQDTKVITDKLQYLPDCGCDDDCTPFTGFIADPRNCPSPTVVTSFSSASADNCCQRTPAGQPAEYFRCISARLPCMKCHECIQTSRQTHDAWMCARTTNPSLHSWGFMIADAQRLANAVTILAALLAPFASRAAVSSRAPTR